MTRQKNCAYYVLFFTILAIMLSNDSHAQIELSCHPTYTSVNAFILPNDQRPIPMLTETSSGMIFSTTKTFIKKNENDALTVYSKFDDDIQYSFPFNVYAILIVQRGQLLAHKDFTYGCSGPGISFFPGHVQELAVVKSLPFPNDPIQIILWGKL